MRVWSAGTASAVVSEQVIYTFTGVPKGLYPLTKLVYGSRKLYGATSSGGTATCKCGTVFGLVPKTRRRLDLSHTVFVQGRFRRLDTGWQHHFRYRR